MIRGRQDAEWPNEEQKRTGRIWPFCSNELDAPTIAPVVPMQLESWFGVGGGPDKR